jgi:Plastocyanin
MKLGHCRATRCAGWRVWFCLWLAASLSRAATVMVDVGPDGTMSFSPDPVEINQGDTVSWVWSNSEIPSYYGYLHPYHSVTSGTPSQPTSVFDSGVHQYPYTFDFTFPDAGTFPYHCMVHGAMMTSSVKVNATANPTATPSTLGNISTRLPVQTGDNVLIAGFIVTGSQPKKIIVRGIGPSLSLTGTLADPFLELRDGSGQLLESNDNWMDSANKQRSSIVRFRPVIIWNPRSCGRCQLMALGTPQSCAGQTMEPG